MPPPSPSAIAEPSECPFCASLTVIVSTKGTDTYARCAQCGEIWHTRRLQQVRHSRRW